MTVCLEEGEEVPAFEGVTFTPLPLSFVRPGQTHTHLITREPNIQLRELGEPSTGLWAAIELSKALSLVSEAAFQDGWWARGWSRRTAAHTVGTPTSTATPASP
jgi:hypothetical protein